MTNVNSLQKGISQVEVQVANAENERSYQAAKTKELMISAANSQGKEEMIDNSVQVVELSTKIDKLKEQLNFTAAANEKMIREKEIENQELKGRCEHQKRRILLLERRNQELQDKIKMLERSARSERSVDQEPVQKLRLDSLPPPPMTGSSNNRKEDGNYTTDAADGSDGEYEDEDYGHTYYAQHEDLEENLPASPRMSRARERSGSMPLGGDSPRLVAGKEERRRASDTIAFHADDSRVTQRQGEEDKSISSVGYDEQGSIVTQKANANLTRDNPRLRRSSETSRSQNKSPISLSGRSVTSSNPRPRRSSETSRSQNKSPISLSGRSVISSILREYDSPASVKKRAAGSTTSPFRSPRFLRNVASRSSTRKASMTPSQSSKGKPNIDRADSTPDLMSTPRRAAAKAKLQVSREAMMESTDSANALTNSPRKQKENSRDIKVRGQTGTYTGPIRDDVPHGVGTIVFANGDTYIGNVANGKLHGCGTLYYVDKKKGNDRGIWKNNDRIWQ